MASRKTRPSPKTRPAYGDRDLYSVYGDHIVTRDGSRSVCPAEADGPARVRRGRVYTGHDRRRDPGGKNVAGCRLRGQRFRLFFILGYDLIRIFTVRILCTNRKNRIYFIEHDSISIGMKTPRLTN